VRLVLDTNVVVSAVIWGGMPYRLLQAAADGDIELYTSPALLAELRSVLAREHLASRLARQQSSAEQAIRFYGELAISVSPLVIPHAVPRDADDDQVIAAALAAQADLIVSGDNDLLTLGQYQSITIVMPAQAVQLVGR
jgi:putative PIN family toxin of toxin-antitoxin system